MPRDNAFIHVGMFVVIELSYVCVNNVLLVVCAPITALSN